MIDFFESREELKDFLIKDFSISMTVINEQFINDFFELNQSIKRFINSDFTFSVGSHTSEYIINDFAGFDFHDRYDFHKNYHMDIKRSTFSIKSESVDVIDFALGANDFPTQYRMKSLEDINIKKFIKENFRFINKNNRKKFELAFDFLQVVKEILSIATKNGLEMKEIINLNSTYNKKELVVIMEDIRNLLLITKDIDIGKITNNLTLKLN